jgi:glycosyltransferase involved in cell wall biosynthesis
MSFGLPVLVSDIPANREVNLPKERYFRCGDVPDLAGKLAALMSRPGVRPALRVTLGYCRLCFSKT